MSLPVGFYAIHAADPWRPQPPQPTDPVFVRARYVCPIEQAFPWLYQTDRFEHYPRLVLYGGPTTRSMDVRYQQIMREHAAALPKQPITVPEEWHAFGIWFVAPQGFSAVAGSPVPVWRGSMVLGGVKISPPWPSQAFAWSWALETSAPQGHMIEFDANGQHPRLIARP